MLGLCIYIALILLKIHINLSALKKTISDFTFVVLGLSPVCLLICYLVHIKILCLDFTGIFFGPLFLSSMRHL